MSLKLGTFWILKTTRTLKALPLEISPLEHLRTWRFCSIPTPLSVGRLNFRSPKDFFLGDYSRIFFFSQPELNFFLPPYPFPLTDFFVLSPGSFTDSVSCARVKVRAGKG
ncbi:F-box protein SKIP19 [Corchorus olitorius]|uniref:F-box protein SKIP19 n=1 Tax=Corchorus olitorius TaxID=93759 RepID=A0A1R3I4E1_9ROSI|nr:F-box protein SKIP19 [Corchorus olitorius]